jgi:integron integrase
MSPSAIAFDRRSLHANNVAALPPLQAPRLLDRLRERIRLMHYSLQTERAYVHWCRAFIRFHALRHPSDMGKDEVEAFLTHLASDRGVAPSTHRQALSALLFLYGKVLEVQLPWMAEIGRPVPKRRLPVVLAADEVAAVLAHLTGEHALMARLLYGTGLRINEGLRLRVKDLDFSQRAVFVREGKGGKDRVVMLPDSLVADLRAQLGGSRLIWGADVAAGQGGVELPHALERKYPRAGSSWTWFWVFPQDPCRPIRAAASSGATTSMPRPSSAPSSAPCSGPASPSRPRRTRCATASPRTCCRPAATSAPCRSCWAMPTWPPR